MTTNKNKMNFELKKKTEIPVRNFLSFLLLIFFFFQFCTDDWDAHYNSPEETVKMNLWDAIKLEPRYSLYVSYIQKYSMDTIFENRKSYTLFIPPDDALQSVPDTGDVIPKMLAYHISPSVFLLKNVINNKKLITSSGKYVVIEAENGGYTYDGKSVVSESPLFNNGRFYEISEPAVPKLNLYEFTQAYSAVIKSFIDLQDSIFLDLTASRPIGFDPSGNTIYDSVVGTVNLIEKYYFPVKKEFRDKTATFILFTQEQYQLALNDMASRLKGNFNTWEDIPLSWQNKVLMPEMIRIGMFANSLNYTDLIKDSLTNIRGERVKSQYMNIDPLSRFESSNGVIFTYSNFAVPHDMYLNNVRSEGENLVDSLGAGRFAWKNEVKVTGAIVEPSKQSTPFESMVNVDLGRNYKGQYTVEFPIKDVWPARYRLVWRANYRPGGLYAVYINGLKIGQYDTYGLRLSVISVTGERYLTSGNGYNRKDFWVDNITDFGDVTIKFEYLGSGGQATNGFNLDYVELIPVIE